MSSQRIVDLRKGRPAPSRETPSRPPSRNADRRSPLRTRRRKFRLFIALAAALLLGGCLYGLHVLSYLPRFSIQQVRVTGTQKMPSEIVAAYVNEQLDLGANNFFSRRNILLYHKVAIQNAIVKNFPRIVSATLGRGAPLSTDLTVNIVEREPFALWCKETLDSLESCFVMDEHGFIFADNTDTSVRVAQTYHFSGGVTAANPVGARFAPGHLPGIVAMMKLLSNAEFTATSAAIQSDQDFYITLQQGFFVKASYGQDAVQLVRNLQLILTSTAIKGHESDLDYIDLRFGNRVYYKFKGQAESPAQ